MDKQSKVLLSDLYATAVDWFQDRESIEKKKKLGILKQQIEVVEYMPLQGKEQILKKIDSWLEDRGQELCDTISSQEYAIIMFGLLQYTNIEYDLDTLEADYMVYDALMFSGIISDILKVCTEDFARLQLLVDRMLHLHVFLMTLESVTLLDLDKAGETADKIGKMYEDLGQKTISDLADIAKANDPAMGMLKTVAEINAAQGVKTKE